MNHISSKTIQTFLHQLETEIKLNWVDIHHWTFTELFSFIQACCNTFFKSQNCPLDLFKDQKHQQNQRFIHIYTMLKEHLHSLKPETLYYLCIKANWTDSYTQECNTFLQTFPEEINELLDNEHHLHEIIEDNSLFNYRALLYDLSGSPKTILYECDNHGEIFIDLLFIETLLKQNHRIILCARQNPILNDVTYTDLLTLLKAHELSDLTPYVKSKQLSFITHGSSDVIVRRTQMTKPYIDAYTKSDLLILKGQGNFESYPKHKNQRYLNPHYHLFGIKSSFTLRSAQKIYNKANLNTPVLLEI